MKKLFLSLLMLFGFFNIVWASNFSTTSVLYSAITANVNPLPVGSFSQYGSHALKVVSNQIVGTSATSTINGASYNVSSYSNFTEAYATITTPATTTGDSVYIQDNFNFGANSGYELQYFKNTAGIDNLTLQRIVAGGFFAQIGPSVLQNVSAGDVLGISYSNGILQLHYKPSGGFDEILFSVSIYTFSVTASTVSVGDIYTDNSGNLYKVAHSMSGGTSLITSGNIGLTPTGTVLTKVSGAGGSSATITFSSFTTVDTGYTKGNIGIAMSYATTSPGLNNFGGGNSVLTPVTSPPYTCTTNYYISPSGNDSNNGTGSGTPWLTQAHAKSVLAAISSDLPNYCLNYAPGTYTAEPLVIDSFGGDATGYVTFRCTQYHGCTLSVPPADVADSVNAENFKIYGENYLAFDGFDLEGAANTYIFTVTSANATAGAVYSNNGGNYTVITTIAGATTLVTSSTNNLPVTGSTLTKVSGTGDATITFSNMAYATDVGILTATFFQTNPTHHLVVINNIIANHGGGGIQGNNMDYFIIEGNVVHDNAFNSIFEESGISDYQPVASDAVAGNHNIITGNLIYNNKEVNDSFTAHTDGNGLIMDDFEHDQSEGTGLENDITAVAGAITACAPTSGHAGTNFQVGDLVGIVQPGGILGQCLVATLSGSAVATETVYTAGTGYTTAGGLSINNNYTQASLVQGNVIHDNGGGGIHDFFTDNVTAINNTTYNNNLDPLNIGTYRGDINVIQGSNDSFINNIGYGIIGSGTLINNIGCLDAGATSQNTGNVWYNNICFSGKTGLASTFINETTATISSGSPYFNIIGINPNFNSIPLSDFSLSNGYPAKGMGTPAFGFPTSDFAGSSIASGNVPVGAYQYTVANQQSNGQGDIY